MNHEHHHDLPNDRKILAISFSLITVFMIIEFIGGWYSNSLALLADAGHMVNDSLSLFFAWVALFLSVRKQHIFAFINGVSLIVVAVLVFWEAVLRYFNPIDVHAIPMLVIAVLGFIANMLVAKIMLQSERKNLNIKAAYLHVLADLLGSVITILAALSTYFLNWQWVDTVASAMLSVFILHSGWQVCQASWRHHNHL